MNATNKMHAFAMGYGWKILFGLAVIFAIASFLCYPAVDKIRQQVKNIEAKRVVTDLLKAQETAWNEGNLDGFMLGYWNDPGLTFYSDNTIEKGYEPLKQRYFNRYKDEGKEMGKLTFSDLECTPLRNLWCEYVIVRGHWKVEKSKETAEGLFTLWIEKKQEGWRIIHDHTSAAPKAP